MKNYIKTIIKPNTYLFLLAISFIIIFLSFSLFTFPWGDDFGWLRSLKYTGPLKYSIRRYFEFEGRMLSVQGLFKTYLFYIFLNNVKPIIFIWISSFIAAGIFIKKSLFAENGIVIKDNQKDFIITVSIVAIIFLLLHKILGVIAFWSTGGSYSLVLLFFFITIYLSEKYKREDNIKQKGIFAFFAFAVGTSGFYINVAFAGYLFFLFIEMILYKKISLKKTLNYLFYVIIPFMIGAYIVIKAPGNAKRIELMHYHLTFNLYDLIVNSIKILDMFTRFYFSNILISGILLFFIISFISNNKEKIHIEVWQLIKWPIIGTASILSFAPLVKAASFHVGLIFALGWTFFIAKLLLIISRIFKIKFSNQWLEFYLFFIILLGFFRISADVYKQYDFYTTEFKPFETKIKEHRYHTLKVCPYDLGKAPFRYRKVRFNEKNWLNRAVSDYYRLKSIKMQKCECKYIDNLQDYDVSDFYRNNVRKLKKEKQWLSSINLLKSY